MIRHFTIIKDDMNLATDNLNKSGIFKILCLDLTIPHQLFFYFFYFYILFRLNIFLPTPHFLN